MNTNKNILDIVNSYRAALLSGEKDAADRLTDGYGVAWRKIKPLLDIVTQQIGDARARGETVNTSWLYRQQRYQTLLDQAGAAIEAWSKVAAGTITAQQAQAVILGTTHAQKMTAAQIDAAVSHSWNNVPHSALEHLIGAMGDGSPLVERFAQLAPTGVEKIKDALIEGVVIGKGPRDIARDVRNAAAVPLDQALVISRTEVLRSAREASRAAMIENPDTVQCWVWLSSHSARTCAACIFMDGSEHPLDEPMASHPCCRCVMSPKVHGSTKVYEAGEDWLRKQPEAAQDAILGKKSAVAWRDGSVSLGDFVSIRHSNTWGDSVQVRSLKSAAKAADARAGRPPAGTGGGAPPPGPPKPPAPPTRSEPPPERDAWTKDVQRNRAPELAVFARGNNMTVEEYERQVAAHLKNLLSTARAFHRIADPTALKGILADGRFKSQFETQRSGGYLDPAYRAKTEKAIFGYPEDLPPHRRPIYGYLHDDVNGLPVHEDTENYGSITARFKPSVIPRASFTGGDSMEVTDGGVTPAVAPMPISAPGWQALNDWTGDALNYPTLKSLIDKATATDGIKYLEAQLHHGIRVKDIKELLFHEDEPDDEIKRLLVALSIPWKMVK